jgi:gliding motility-associated lipoprotein GldJ
MKMREKISGLIIVMTAIAMASCGGGKSGVSSTTGWEYNNPDNGGFEVVDYNEQAAGPGLVLIEGGTFVMGRVDQDVMYDWNNTPKRATVTSFYMDETEVRNVDYREYLHWLRRVYIDYPQVYLDAMPDTLVWLSPLSFNEPYVEYYFRHPAYDNYPVVGVSWKQANAYASWRTDRVNEKILIDNGILDFDPNQSNAENFNTDAYLAGQYEGIVLQNLPSLDPNQGERRVRMEDGILLPKYRLPTEAEWEYAAFGLIGNTTDERVYSRRIYPWNGDFQRNDGMVDGESTRGQFRANFVRGKGDYMGVAGSLNDDASITAPVDSYWPNDFGLYCMAGNVNEWVLDVYRQLSFEDMEDFRPFRGNVYTTKMRDEEGNLLEKDSLGRIRYRELNEEETSSRFNFRRSDNKNYMDGDVKSSIVEGDDWTGEETQGSSRMYYQGKGAVKQGITSLVTDNTRVYKGGGWNDRVYWLSPGTRRFLDENSSRANLGFRCAMIRVGSPAGIKR